MIASMGATASFPSFGRRAAASSRTSVVASPVRAIASASVSALGTAAVSAFPACPCFQTVSSVNARTSEGAAIGPSLPSIFAACLRTSADGSVRPCSSASIAERAAGPAAAIFSSARSLVSASSESRSLTYRPTSARALRIAAILSARSSKTINGPYRRNNRPFATTGFADACQSISRMLSSPGDISGMKRPVILNPSFVGTARLTRGIDTREPPFRTNSV